MPAVLSTMQGTALMPIFVDVVPTTQLVNKEAYPHNSPHHAQRGDKCPLCIHPSANGDSRKASLVTGKSCSQCWPSKIHSITEDSNPCSNISAQEYQLNLMERRQVFCVQLADLHYGEFTCNAHLLGVTCHLLFPRTVSSPV